MAELTCVRDAQTGETVFSGRGYQEVEDWYAKATTARRVHNAWEVSREFRNEYVNRHERGEFWVVFWL